MSLVGTYEALKFELSGRSAFFKKPDANAYAYFTYNNIHKIALLGLLGAVLGYGGYTRQNDGLQRKEKQAYPEFYSRLEALKVCIIPNAECGYFSKKIQQFNNSAGYASQEQGGNLIVREQWLEDPSWTVYILNSGDMTEEFCKISDSLLNGRCMYVPYLGKNDHPAVIEKCEIVKLEQAQCEYFSCLFPEGIAERGNETFDGADRGYIFKEFLPCKMNSELNFYEQAEFVFTNYMFKDSVETDLTFAHGDDRLIFY